MMSDPYFVTIHVEFNPKTREPQRSWLDQIVGRVLTEHVTLASGCARIPWARTEHGYSARIPLVFACDPDGYAAQLRDAFAELTNPRVTVQMLGTR